MSVYISQANTGDPLIWKQKEIDTGKWQYTNIWCLKKESKKKPFFYIKQSKTFYFYKLVVLRKQSTSATTPIFQLM